MSMFHCPYCKDWEVRSRVYPVQTENYIESGTIVAQLTEYACTNGHEWVEDGNVNLKEIWAQEDVDDDYGGMEVLV